MTMSPESLESPELPQLWVTVETEEIIEEAGPVRGERDGRRDAGGGWNQPVTDAIKRVIHRDRIPLDVQLLQSQMNGLLSVVGDIFDKAAEHPKMQLSELQLSVEINGEGQVNLVGNGAKLGNRGGISLKFTAKEAADK